MDFKKRSVVKNMSSVVHNIRCLACDSANTHMALDLGIQPLANSYKSSSDTAEDRYPLGVSLCHDCFHLQLTHTVDPEIIYKNYLYATGTNKTIQEYSNWFSKFVKEYTGVSGSILDIGCNDGTQLNYFLDQGFTTYGIDPAKNLHASSSKRHNVVCDFFGPKAVEQLKTNEYDVIIAQNVFAHNPSPVDFLSSCQQLMSDNTLLFVQTSQADMVLHNEFDTIYHEHINFFNANSMNQLVKRVGLNLIDVIKTPIHGNSYIFVLSRTQQRPAHVDNIIAMEQGAGLLDVDTYVRWNTTVQNIVNELKSQLEHYKNQGYVLVGYGAAAKGMTLINFSDIYLDFIIDDSPLKQGLYTPGTGTSIVSRDHLAQYNETDRLLFVPLAWNFFKEIKSTIQATRNNPQDRFIKYFPCVEIS